MTRTDLDLLLDQIPTPGRKVFKYIQEFIHPHYITIEKVFKEDSNKNLIKIESGGFEVTYKIIKEESTCEIPNFDDDLFYKMLMKEELVLVSDGKWYMNILSYRTEGCDCGAWATLNPTCHAHWCRRYFK